MIARARWWAGFALLGVIATAACGDDSDDRSAVGDGGDGGPRGDRAEFCEARVDLEQAIIGDDRDAIPAALAQLRESAPARVSRDVSLVAEALRVDTELLYGDAHVAAARAAIDETVIDDCDFQVVDVRAEDYLLEGIPASLEAETTVFRLNNHGAEVHEVVIVQVPDDLAGSIEDLGEGVLAMSRGAAGNAEHDLIEVATAAWAPPGETDTAVGRLAPGHYAAFCLIPVGSSGEDEGGGPPHYREGMYAEFTVK